MHHNKKRTVVVLGGAAVLPALLYAFAGGPEPRHTGAPGDTTCAQIGCHTGTAVNGGPGRVEIAFPSGLTYVPGQRQRWTITVTDSGQQVFGFQATARLASNETTGQAGSFSLVDTAATQILCDDGAVKPAAGCRAGFTVEFVQHSRPSTTGVFTVEWTPPATDVGNVRVYVAGNAANNNRLNTGDRVYTASYTLTPQAGGGNRPTIAQGGIANAFSFQGGAVAANTFMAIFGSNLASTTKTWDDAIQGNRLPTTVEGVSVTVNNRPATVVFVSPTQVNILSPADDAVGDGIQVVVRNAGGESAPVNIRKQRFFPSFYSPFAQGDRLFVTAVSLTGEFVGKQGLDPRVTRGARPGEILQVFGTGFGPTTPAADPTLIVSGAPAVNTPPVIRIGDAQASFLGTGNLVAAGLYQFNVTIPDTLQNGDHAIVAEVDGIRSAANVFLTVQR